MQGGAQWPEGVSEPEQYLDRKGTRLKILHDLCSRQAVLASTIERRNEGCERRREVTGTLCGATDFSDSDLATEVTEITEQIAKL